MVARVEVKAHIQPPSVEDHLGAGLARDQLAAGGVDGAAGSAGQHAVEAPPGHVAEGDRDRADRPDPIGLAGEHLQQGQRALWLRRLDPNHLESETRALGSQLPAVERGSLTATGEVLLAGAEVVHVAELDVGHRRAPGDGDAERVRGKHAAGVQRAVERIDDRAYGRPGVAEHDLAALLGDGRELVSLGVQPLQLAEDDVLAAAIDGERAVAALADPGVDGAGRDSAHLGEQLALGGDHAPAGGEPIHFTKALAGGGPVRLGGVLARHPGHASGRLASSSDARPAR